jgi:hypothetical protein
MTNWKRGDFVEFDGLLAVIVRVAGDPDVPDDHVAVWMGEPRCARRSQGGSGGQSPEIWTVPVAYITVAANAVVKH